MRSFLVRKIKNFTKTPSLRAKVSNTYGTRLYCRLLKVICFSVFFAFSPNLFACRPYQIKMSKFMFADEDIAYFENLNFSFSESDSDTDNVHEGMHRVLLSYCNPQLKDLMQQQTRILMTTTQMTSTTCPEGF